MKKQVVRSSYAIACVLILFACKKDLQKENNKSLTAKKDEVKSEASKRAEMFFKATVLTPVSIKTASVGHPQAQANKHIQLIPGSDGRMADLYSKINWTGGFEMVERDRSFLFVPMAESLKPFKNQEFEFVRYLIFETITGEIKNMNVIEILADRGTKLPNGKLNAIAAYENFIFEERLPIQNLNASIFVFNAKYAQQKSFRVDNGYWNASRISFRSDLEIRYK